MSLAGTTGRRQRQACGGCGLVLEHAEVRYYSGPAAGSSTWSVEKHAAPCGLPCLYGGVGTEVIRPMREAKKKLYEVVHGATRSGDKKRVCPTCGILETGS